jgi:hypothetical protein
MRKRLVLNDCLDIAVDGVIEVGRMTLGGGSRRSVSVKSGE